MTKKLHLCRIIDGRIIGNIQSINCDGFSILDAFENKKSGEYVLFNDRLEEIGRFNDHGMSFENREIGEMVKDEIERARLNHQNDVPLIKGEGMLVLMNGYLEFREDGKFAIVEGEIDYPIVLEKEPPLELIDDYVTLVGTMRVIDGKSMVSGLVKEHDGSTRPCPTLFGSGVIDIKNKKFIADMEEDFENSVSIDMDEEGLADFAEALEPNTNKYIAGVLHYDGEEYSFAPRAIIQASMSVNKKHQPEMGMMS